jgi:hypothetical protein
MEHAEMRRGEEEEKETTTTEQLDPLSTSARSSAACS